MVNPWVLYDDTDIAVKSFPTYMAAHNYRVIRGHVGWRIRNIKTMIK